MALSHIKFTIPTEVLNEAFKTDYDQAVQVPISLDAKITNKVINPRVLVDTNTHGGRMAIIPLTGLHADVIENGLIYNIPPERTQYQSIMSVLSVNYLPNQNLYYQQYYSTHGCDSNNPLVQVANRVGMSAGNLPIVSTAIIDLVGENTVLIQNITPMMGNYAVRCIIANDANFTNINPRTIPALQKLCELAVKSYIYNRLYVRIDQAYLQGGLELGAFKNVVENYSDAEEQYQTHLSEVWQPAAFMNDTLNYDRFIRLQISPGL